MLQTLCNMYFKREATSLTITFDLMPCKRIREIETSTISNEFIIVKAIKCLTAFIEFRDQFNLNNIHLVSNNLDFLYSIK